MKAIWLYFLLPIAGFFSCSAPGKDLLNVRSKFISMYLDLEHGGYWEALRPMPAGEFSCEELSDGKLHLHYSKGSEVVVFSPIPAGDSSIFKKAERKIGDYVLKGAYDNLNSGGTISYLVYQGKTAQEGLLLVGYLPEGDELIGASLYTNLKVHPLKEEKIVFKK